MKKRLHKCLAIILACILAVSCTGVAFAASSGAGGTPPEKPAGQESSGNASGGNASGGNAPGGNAPDGNAQNGGAPGEQSNGVDSYQAVKEYTENGTYRNETISSTGTDENAVLVSDGKQVFSGVSVSRTSADSTGGDNASFYGVGAAVLAKGGSTYLSKSKIETDANGGTGVFAYGDGTAYVADTTINTSKDTSGALHVAGGGTLYAWDVTAVTQGTSSAAIRSDRGGGKLVVDGGSYTSNGTNSPAVYVTADVAIHEATLVANGAEGLCLEGKNSVHLYDSNLTSSMPDSQENDCTWSVIVYQSQSGDAEEGEGVFQMDGGSITSKNGGIFYTTNTKSDFVLKNVSITAASDSEFFLKCTGNSNSRGWGTTGQNGADCRFTAIQQNMKGNVLWDSTSTLQFFMTDGSNLTGAVLQDESNAGNGGDGTATVAVDKSSTWIVTADSTVTNLYQSGEIVDNEGNPVTIKGTDGTVYVKGSSAYTVTVTGTYGTYEDCTAQPGELDSWSDYEEERPSELKTEESAEEAEDEFPVWAIVLISGLGAILLGALLFFLVRRKKQNGSETKPQ